jgi:hypothetical protein
MSNISLIRAMEASVEGTLFMNAMRAIRKAHADDESKKPSYYSLLQHNLPELTAMYMALDVAVYGNYVHDMTVKYKLFPNNKGYRTARHVNVRSKSATSPTTKEIKEGLVFASREEGPEEDYKQVVGPNAVIAGATSNSSPVNVDRSANWHDRHHFGNALNYMGINQANVPDLAGVLAGATESKTCGYDIACEHLNITPEAIEAIVGKTRDQGLTCPDLVKIYMSQKRTLYCFDLMGCIDSGVLSHEERRRDQQEPFVLILANQHVYEPDALTRASLLKKTPDKMYVEEEKKAPKPKQEEIVLFADTLAEALELAGPIAREQDAVDPVVLIAAQKTQQRTIEGQLAGAKTETHARKRTALRKPLKEALKKVQTKLAELRKGPKSLQRKKVRIYIKTRPSDLGIAYFDHIAETNQVYDASVTIDAWVSNIHHSPGIEIYANEDYEKLAKVAVDLDISYKNQTIHALARIAFDGYNESDERGRGQWEHSVLNTGVRDLLDLNKSKALTMCQATTIGPDESVHGVDFYRNYASKAREGDFYRVPLMADVEPYDGHVIGQLPAMYFVETADNVLFGGNGTYDYKIVAYGLEIGAIAPADVKWQIRCVASPAIDRVAKGFVDYVYASVKDDKSRKTLVNSWIGSLGSCATMSALQSIIMDNSEEAAYYYNTINKERRQVREVFSLKTDRPLYLVTGFTAPMKRHTDDVVRRAIVDRGRMDVVKLMRTIGQMPGCRVISVKTDCVTYARKTGAKGYQVSPTPPTFGSTRHEHVKPESEYKAYTQTPCVWKPDEARAGWKPQLCKVSATEYFNAKRLLKYDRVFVEGFAGSGKSHILNALYGLLLESGLRKDEVIKMAFTHAAARIIDGETAHSVCGIGRYGHTSEKQVKRLMNDTKVLLIDEMSMIPEEIYVIISQLPKGVKVYGFGDFRQFEPIEYRLPGKRYLNSTMFQSMFGYNKITLKKQCRTNTASANACVNFYDAAMETSVWRAMNELPTEINLVTLGGKLPLHNICYTNGKRIEINRRVMEQEGIEQAPMKDRVLTLRDIKPGNRYEYERFDARKLAWIVNHADIYAPMLSDSRSREPEECMLLARKYMANAEIDTYGWGTRRVEYYKPGGRGRWQPAEGQSLASITRKIRRTIASEEMVDIDMVNCHPVILNRLCALLDLDTPYLTEYVNKRDEVFKRLHDEMHALRRRLCAGDMEDIPHKLLKSSLNRDVLKKLCLAMINGGMADFRDLHCDKIEWTIGFKAELERIAETFIAKYPDKYKEHIERRRAKAKWEGSDKGAFVNMFMLEKEAAILDVIVDRMKRYKLLGEDGRQVVLCADGLMCPKSPKINDALLRECEGVIMDELGIVVRLEFKPMEPLELPDNLPMPTFDDSWLPLINADMYDEFPCVAKGMPVIASKTRKAHGYYNNQTMTIVDLGHQGLWEGKAADKPKRRPLEEPVPMLLLRDDEDGTEYQFTTHTLRTDFRPAYCITAHKAQGAEIKEYAIHEFEHFDAHGAYVSITRASDVSKIAIIVAGGSNSQNEVLGDLEIYAWPDEDQGAEMQEEDY